MQRNFNKKPVRSVMKNCVHILQSSGLVGGFFELANELFGISIQRVAGERTGTTSDAEFQIWHDDVRVYQIYDEDGSYIGLFYADLFPREGKRGGAWMNPLYTHT